MQLFHLIKTRVFTLLIGVGLLGLIAHAEGASKDIINEESPLSYMPKMENVRNPNKYCAQCHVFSKSQFHGRHLEEENPNTGEPITCTSCHGNISEDHLRGAPEVMRFHDDLFDKEKAKYSPTQQNQVCLSCHQPKDLEQAFWPHNVHATKLSCASCHKLHPKEEPMQNISHKSEVKMCVDCHSKQQELRKDKQKNNTSAKSGN